MKTLFLILISFSAFAQDMVYRVHTDTNDTLLLIRYNFSATINVRDGMVYKWKIPATDTARFFLALDGDYEITATFKKLGTTPDPDPIPNTGKISFTTAGGVVKIAGVDGTNPVLYDNDFWGDTPDDDLLNHLHSKGLVKLVGHVITHNPDPYFTNDKTVSYANRDMIRLANTPPLVMGSSTKMLRPADGNIDSTVPRLGPGVDLIISEAKKATPEKPLVIFVGGQCTSVASAYLKDKSIADRVVVLQTAGYWNKPNVNQSYNTNDPWSAYVVMKRMKYVNANYKFAAPFPHKYWYQGQTLNLSLSDVSALPSTPINNAVKKWYTERFKIEYMADACPVLWFFNNSLWRNVERRKENGAIVTGNDYDFLMVSDNNWAGYGPELIKQLKR